jgi:hypothetical protein
LIMEGALSRFACILNAKVNYAQLSFLSVADIVARPIARP